MANNPSVLTEFPALQEKLASQFRGLDTKDPSGWPALPRYLLFVVVAVAIVVALWFLWINSSEAELETERATEVKLREDYKFKLAKAVNLDALKKQREQVLQYVTQLEKQLPSSVPRRDGIALKNQMCATGAARLMCPIRFLRTRLWVTLTPQRSQIMPLYFMPRYLPQEHSQSFSGPKMRSQKRPSFSGRYVR